VHNQTGPQRAFALSFIGGLNACFPELPPPHCRPQMQLAAVLQDEPSDQYCNPQAMVSFVHASD
jgi:hypothetical protein